MSSNIPEWLFHATPLINAHSIAENGISPSFAPKGKKRVSWYVPIERIEWAIIHVSSKYRLDTNNILVYAVRAGKLDGFSRWMDTPVMTNKRDMFPHGSVWAWKVSLDLSMGIDLQQSDYWGIPF